MFRLTKTEKQIVAFVLLAFLAGWSYRQWTAREAFGQAAEILQQDERND